MSFRDEFRQGWLPNLVVGLFFYLLAQPWAQRLLSRLLVLPTRLLGLLRARPHNVTITPPAGSLSLTGYPPVITISSPPELPPGTAGATAMAMQQYEAVARERFFRAMTAPVPMYHAYPEAIAQMGPPTFFK